MHTTNKTGKEINITRYNRQEEKTGVQKTNISFLNKKVCSER